MTTTREAPSARGNPSIDVPWPTAFTDGLPAAPHSGVKLVDAQAQDSFWSHRYQAEPYYRDECDYEDYAPAYCVGYSGCAQYGGNFEDEERSLHANWERIKGDSRLCWETAREAVRAAWDRVAMGSAPEGRWAM